MRFDIISLGLVPLVAAASVNRPQTHHNVKAATTTAPAGQRLDMFPYNMTDHADLPQVILAPLNHPKSGVNRIDGLKPKARHLVWFADSNQPIRDGGRPVSAALLVSMKSPVINLAASDLVTDIHCTEKPGKGQSKIKVFFKSQADAKSAMNLWWKDGKVRQTFMDAYGSGCGKQDVLQFFHQANTIKRTPVKEGSSWTLTMCYDEVAETDIVTDFRLGWGDDHKKCLNSQHGTQYKRDVDNLELEFEGSWPETGLVPMAAKASIKRRGLGWSGYTWDKTYPVDFTLKSDNTPWGAGKLLWSDDSKGISVSCVGCGISGTVKTSGSISWSLFKGVTGAKAYVSQSSVAQLAIGISASANYATHGDASNPLSAEIKKTFTYPLSPFHLGGFLTAGPSISLEPFLQGQVKTTGKILLGGALEWKDANAEIDLMNLKNSQKNNWAPTPKAIFDLEAEISAEARAGVRFSLDFGVTVTVGKTWKKGVSLTEEPSVYAKAGAALSSYLAPNGTLVTNLQSPKDANCKGMSFEMGFDNRLYATVDIIGKKDYDLWKIDPVKIWGHCWDFEEISSWFKKDNPACGYGQQCFKNNPGYAGKSAKVKATKTIGGPRGPRRLKM